MNWFVPATELRYFLILSGCLRYCFWCFRFRPCRPPLLLLRLQIQRKLIKNTKMCAQVNEEHPTTTRINAGDSESMKWVPSKRESQQRFIIKSYKIQIFISIFYIFLITAILCCCWWPSAVSMLLLWCGGDLTQSQIKAQEFRGNSRLALTHKPTSESTNHRHHVTTTTICS